mmetsp:Transcript_13873/g.43515  ORF Transcript_13873/g.43515 Transcript_13873/m.43515 type:complete len:207 (-) Transcript_13873:173-793(-)
MDARIKGAAGAAQHLDGQRSHHIRLHCQHLGARQRLAAHRHDELGAVDHRQPLLGAQLDRREPEPGQLLCGRHELFLRVAPRKTLTHEPQRQVAEWRQVAAGAHGAAERHTRQEVGVEGSDELPQCRQADAAVALGQHVDSQAEHAAHLREGHGRAHPRAVRANEVALQLAQLVLLDGDGGELTEARIDTVHGLPLVHQPLHHGAP